MQKERDGEQRKKAEIYRDRESVCMCIYERERERSGKEIEKRKL